MAKIDEKVIEGFTGIVPECLKSIRAYLAYQGDNARYREQARVAATTASATVKLLGTVANMESNDILRHKLGMKAGG